MIILLAFCHSDAFSVLLADGIIDDVLARIPATGGNVIVPRTPITPEIGDFAMFIDSGSNKVALHTPPPRESNYFLF